MKKGPQALLLETPASSEGREKAGVNKQNKTKQSACVLQGTKPPRGGLARNRNAPFISLENKLSWIKVLSR